MVQNVASRIKRRRPTEDFWEQGSPEEDNNGKDLQSLLFLPNMTMNSVIRLAKPCILRGKDKCIQSSDRKTRSNETTLKCQAQQWRTIINWVIRRKERSCKNSNEHSGSTEWGKTLDSATWWCTKWLIGWLVSSCRYEKISHFINSGWNVASVVWEVSEIWESSWLKYIHFSQNTPQMPELLP